MAKRKIVVNGFEFFYSVGTTALCLKCPDGKKQIVSLSDIKAYRRTVLTEAVGKRHLTVAYCHMKLKGLSGRIAYAYIV